MSDYMASLSQADLDRPETELERDFREYAESAAGKLVHDQLLAELELAELEDDEHDPDYHR